MTNQRRNDAPAEQPRRRDVPVKNTDPAYGLTSAEVRERYAAGLYNRDIDPPTKTVGQIFFTNICTYFNLIFTVIAVLILITGKLENLSFMGVVVANSAIGIVQELRSKRTLDRMALVTSQKCTVIRDGAPAEIRTSETVRDDIVRFSAGNQIFADAVVAEGFCLANEALITGEADEIRKNAGDTLTSGSFIVSGACTARLTHVGEESFASKLTLEAKRTKNRGKSEMMNSLSKLVKWIGIALIPIGIALYLKEIYILGDTWKSGIISTAAAMIGMIPEGPAHEPRACRKRPPPREEEYARPRAGVHRNARPR